MVATIYIIAFILGVMYITYPKEFPELITDPKAMLEAVGMETKRRWMMFTIGTSLWIERKRLAYSLWRMRDTIEKERNKQKQQENNID